MIPYSHSASNTLFYRLQALNNTKCTIVIKIYLSCTDTKQEINEGQTKLTLLYLLIRTLGQQRPRAPISFVGNVHVQLQSQGG